MQNGVKNMQATGYNGASAIGQSAYKLLQLDLLIIENGFQKKGIIPNLLLWMTSYEKASKLDQKNKENF